MESDVSNEPDAARDKGNSGTSSKRVGDAVFPLSTPYLNTIAPEEQPPYPGDRELERTDNAWHRRVWQKRRARGTAGFL